MSELEHYEEELAIAADEIAEEMRISKEEAIDMLIELLRRMKNEQSDTDRQSDERDDGKVFTIW